MYVNGMHLPIYPDFGISGKLEGVVKSYAQISLQTLAE